MVAVSTEARPAKLLRLHEPAVALSDLALAVETSAYAIGVARHGRRSPSTDRSRDLRRWLIAYFASAAAASLAGAAVHGLSASKDDPKRLIFWRASLSSIGMASLSAWQFGAALSLQGNSARTLLAPVYVVHLAYLIVVWRTHPPFRLALALYVPSAFFLRLALLSRLRVPAERRPATMALGGWCGTGRPGAAIVRWMLPRSHHRVLGCRARGMVRGPVGPQGTVRVAMG
ncbi:MAG: hypothetical protein ACC726_05560 [Chloroflexota bacterium]